MSNSQQLYPIHVHTGWVDYSPAFHQHALQRIRSRLAEVASNVRSVAVRISGAESHDSTHRSCHIEIMTTDGPTSASGVGVDLFHTVDSTVDKVAEMLRSRLSAVPNRDLRQRIA